jgi:hypothetical protein
MHVDEGDVPTAAVSGRAEVPDDVPFCAPAWVKSPHASTSTFRPPAGATTPAGPTELLKKQQLHTQSWQTSRHHGTFGQDSPTQPWAPHQRTVGPEGKYCSSWCRSRMRCTSTKRVHRAAVGLFQPLSSQKRFARSLDGSAGIGSTKSGGSFKPQRQLRLNHSSGVCCSLLCTCAVCCVHSARTWSLGLVRLLVLDGSRQHQCFFASATAVDAFMANPHQAFPQENHRQGFPHCHLQSLFIWSCPQELAPNHGGGGVATQLQRYSRNKPFRVQLAFPHTALRKQ